MSNYRRVYNQTHDLMVLEKGKWCASFWCHFKGLMFRRNLPEDEGLIFVRKSKSVMSTTIHMLFCFFPIGVVWVDDEFKVVDVKLAKPWRLSYAPQAAAQYYIEALPSILEHVSIGDQLRFDSD